MRAPRFWWEKPGAAGALLRPFAAAYGAVAAARLSGHGAECARPVICVGNPTLGGAGKTPTALAIAEILRAAGERPAFLTRGYGGALKGPLRVTPQHLAREVGDEARLLARAAPTIVARERVAGAALAAEDASVIVMDDGFQNPALAKDLAILVVDGRRGLGNGRVFPAGPMRAPLDAQLDRAQAVLIVGTVTGAAPVVIAARARRLPLFHATLEPDPDTIAALRGQSVLAFAGIGDPDKFFATLEAAGIAVAVRRGYPDHHRFGRAEAAALIAEAEAGNLRLVTTEKDLARCEGDPDCAELAARALALPVRLVVEEADAFRALVLETVARRRSQRPEVRAPGRDGGA